MRFLTVALGLGLSLSIVVVSCHSRTREDDCRESKGCKQFGKCHAIPEHPIQCVPLRAEECWHSTECIENGTCELGETGCSRSALGCARSEACTKRGLCATDVRSHRDHPLEPVVCAAGARPPEHPVTSESCRASAECKDGGRCSVDPVTQTCVAGTNEDCAASEGCKSIGKCKLVPTGHYCIAPKG